MNDDESNISVEEFRKIVVQNMFTLIESQIEIAKEVKLLRKIIVSTQTKIEKAKP